MSIPAVVVHLSLLVLVALSTPGNPRTAQVAIPGGAFVMGHANGDEDERPARTRTISSFHLDRTEVTYGHYLECVRAGSCTPPHYDDGKCLLWTPPTFSRVTIPARYRGDDVPVVCVTWGQARDYCRFAGKRLPTEAEWEYAARGAKGYEYSWGNEPPSAGRCTMYGSPGPSAVGSYAPGTWGLYDMTGNVWEWTADRYQRDYYTESPDADPPGPEVGYYRVIRGGGWYSTAASLRAGNRNWFSPAHAEASIGFRCAR